MAEAAGCQRSYLSQVIHGNVHLVPDHAYGLSQYFGLSDEEREYFITMLEYARATSEDYKEHIRGKLQELKGEKHSEQKVAPKSYFSSWHWSAIHLLTNLPEYQSPKKLAEFLRLPEDSVRLSLETLAKVGLVKKEKQTWKFAQANSSLKD